MSWRTACCVLTSLALFSACGQAGGSRRSTAVITVSSSEELQTVLRQPLDGVEVRLRPGDYHLAPFETIDSTCGNCEDPATMVPVTVGVQLSGRNVVLAGPEDLSAVIHTHAGYGLYVKDCDGCEIRRIAVTDGERDPDPNATDAAIVVRNSTVTITGSLIFANIGDSATVAETVVGIMGICGRENSNTTVVSNRILRNSWDGIALYRGASASILRNVIDGVDRARGGDIGGGRGVGIGVTWNATALIEGNLVKRYWKGIGLFVDARATVRDNIIEDILTWGISLWDAGKGRPVGRIERNVVYGTGACGISITCADPAEPWGCLKENVVAKTAQNPKYDDPDYYCYQCALALHAVPENFEIGNNVFHGNRRASADLPDYDVDRKTFIEKVRPVCKRLLAEPVLKQADFLAEYCRRKDR